MKNNFSPDFLRGLIDLALVQGTPGDVKLGLLKAMKLYVDESFPAKLAPTYIVKIGPDVPYKIKAIVAIRAWTNMGLKEAKDIIDGTEFQDQVVIQTSDVKLARNLHANLVQAGARSWILEVETEMLS